MKNNIVIVSDDKIVIDTKITKIFDELKLKNVEVIKFNMSDVSIASIVEELDTYNFLADRKVVICYESTFLAGEVNKELKLLKAYLNSPSDNILIMVTASLSDKKEIKDLLSNNVEIIDSNISSEVLVKNNLEEFKMENRTVKYFVEYCSKNNEKILNELEKLKCYKKNDSNKLITELDIKNIVIKDYDIDIFDLVNLIAKRKKKEAFLLYKKLVNKEKDAVAIVASIASQIRLLYSVKVLSNNRVKVEEMAKIINVKPRAISIALENSENFSTKKLLYLLNCLADIDYDNKSGNSQGNNSFELFLLNI